MKTLLQRALRWKRAPTLYCARLQQRLFGINDLWLDKHPEEFNPGTWQWLALTEKRYGGFKTGESTGRCRGGDRMSPHYHGYGVTYEEFLKNWMERRYQPLTIVEVGILNGSGLALWCDLFPQARVIGLDIDLSNFEANLPKLKAAGAFSTNYPELFAFDQLDIDKAARIVENVLGGSKIDIAIDDGLHSIESIEITLQALLPHLACPFVYFIEDNFSTYDAIAKRYSLLKWTQRGEMVVATGE